MSLENYTLSISNKRVWEFYNENPSISFETANLIFLDILDITLKNASSNINNTLQTQILSSIHGLSSQYDDIKDLVSKNNTELFSKISDVKREYMEDVRGIIQNSSSTTNDKISSIVDKNSSHLIDKLSLIMSDFTPKMQTLLGPQFQDFNKSINEMNNQLKLGNNESALKQFSESFEVKFLGMFQNIYSFISQSEERINGNMTTMKETTLTNNVVQERLLKDLGDFLGKYKNSSYKGQFGETQLGTILCKMFPMADIKNTTGQKASGDFIMNRASKPRILFENKDYDRNVNTEEVKKFIRDVETQGCHGIFLSQHTGITSKANYHIDIIGKNILVYVHDVDNSQEKIKNAIDIVDALDIRLVDLDVDSDENTIPKDVLDDINKEYNNFLSQKYNLLQIIKDNHKRTLEHLDEFKFPALEKYLSKKYGILPQVSGQHVCDVCNIYCSTNARSVAAHRKGCVRKTDNIVITTNGGGGGK